MVQLNETFLKVIAERQYKGSYFGVYPIKVNQMREVVEEILDAGAPYNYGLEAGSKGELLPVLALNSNPQAITVCNGYKDEEYLTDFVDKETKGLVGFEYFIESVY